MNDLTFVIPTRKRHRELSACLRSICEQITAQEQDIRVVVLYNHEEDDTVRVVKRCIEKWPFISSESFPGEPDYTEKFRAMFRAAPEAKWVWTFGDDEVLEANALKFVLAQLDKAPDDLSFIHISEKNRSTKSGDFYRGRLIDLCCQFGWLEITGFITGNILRGKKSLEVAETPNWDAYARTAYVQSCAILEVLRKDQALFIDSPLFDSQADLDPDIGKVKEQQWKEANTEVRYVFLADSLQLMYDQGLLKARLPATFFRYHYAHLWNRHLTCYLLLWLNGGKIWFDDWVLYAKKMLNFVAEDDIREEAIQRITSAQRLIIMQSALKENVKIIEDDLIGLLETQTKEYYQVTIADSKTPEENMKVSYGFKAA